MTSHYQSKAGYPTVRRAHIHRDKGRMCLLAVSMLILGGLLFCLQQPAGAQCVDISDTPMDTKVIAAPPNIMFVLDNSGSMDWEFMVQGATDGKFEGDIEYLFDDPGDNVYDTWSSNGDILSGDDRGKVAAQISVHNKLFFDPQVDYKPWPNMPNADTTTPRSNPDNATPTFNLTDEYYAVSNEIIVDDRDPGFSKTGSWGSGSHADAYDNDYYYTSGSSIDITATWLPEPSNQEYEVFARWYTYEDCRSTSVPYTVTHAGGSTQTHKNQNLNSGTWVLLGTFTFSAGTGSVTIDYHVGDDCNDRVCADAIKLQPTSGNIISIKNAHYYTWDDTDDDGQYDGGETVYLVNFVAGVREYYRFMDRNENHIVEGGELVPVLAENVPTSCRAAYYDDEGNFDRLKTDAEDLQNFANWYSFYRRRELAAKAAVATAIGELQGVKIGFYSINSGLRQCVLPVKLNVPDAGGAGNVIVDNKDSGYSESGWGWYESGAQNEYEGSSRYTNRSGRTATWRPNLPAAGDYNVYAWWDYWSTRDTNALYQVNHAGGTYSERVNQRQNYSQWTQLGSGSFTFNAGTAGTVTVTRDSSSTGSSTSADAVRFEQVDAGGGGGTTYVDKAGELLDALYGMDSSGSTPLRLALKNVGRYYHQDDGNDGGLCSSPYETAENGGACQHSFAIVMTDGYWNGSSPSVGNQDGAEGPPYADGYSETLADVAMKYYKEDLSSALDNVVPTSSCDSAVHQHMVTYAVSFGVTGTLNPDDYHECLIDGIGPAWPDPTSNCSSCPKKIDDMWHAAMNGRGLFFAASNPEELLDSLMEVMENIASRSASGASVTVNGEELGTDIVLYQSSYISDGWTGDVTAYPIDPVTGAILKEDEDILWKASDELQLLGWDERKIVTYDGTTVGKPFRFDHLTATQKAALDETYFVDDTNAKNILDYVRGKEIPGFRPRIRKLGDIVHSAPLLVGDTIFVGGNDGMLHAFHAYEGFERFAFVPNLVFPNLETLTHNDYGHKFYVDVTPVAKKYVGEFDKTLLVGALGKGGKGYYALDVSDADLVDALTEETAVATMVLWEYPKEGTTDDDIGYSFSQAFIVKSNASAYGWVIIFGNGYDSVNGYAMLYVLDIAGNVVRKIDTAVGGCNGLSSPSIVDVDKDFKADYAYAGDLKGNLWKFDLTDADPANWDVAYYDSSQTPAVPAPLFQATGQPITTKPDVTQHCERHGYMVFFGTGKYIGDTDKTDTTTQTIYGIWDYGDDEDDSEYLGAFNAATGGLSNQPETVTLLQQVEVDFRTLFGHDLRTLSDYDAVWITEDDTDAGEPMPNPSSSAENHAGWYFNLPLTGERITRDLLIREGKVVIVSVIPVESPCSGGGNSMVHEMDTCTGGRSEGATFDINDDGTIDENDMIDIGLVDEEGNAILVAPTAKSYTGMLYPPVIIKIRDDLDKKYFSTSAGNIETLDEIPERRGMVYWREMVY